MDALEEAMNREALSSEVILERAAKVVADWPQVAPETVDENTAIGETARAR